MKFLATTLILTILVAGLSNAQSITDDGTKVGINNL